MKSQFEYCKEQTSRQGLSYSEEGAPVSDYNGIWNSKTYERDKMIKSALYMGYQWGQLEPKPTGDFVRSHVEHALESSHWIMERGGKGRRKKTGHLFIDIMTPLV